MDRTFGKVKNIIKFARKLISIDSNAKIDSIQSIMKSKNISRLPIIDNKKYNSGLIEQKKLWWLKVKKKQFD